MEDPLAAPSEHGSAVPDRGPAAPVDSATFAPVPVEPPMPVWPDPTLAGEGGPWVGALPPTAAEVPPLPSAVPPPPPEPPPARPQRPQSRRPPTRPHPASRPGEARIPGPVSPERAQPAPARSARPQPQPQPPPPQQQQRLSPTAIVALVVVGSMVLMMCCGSWVAGAL